MTAHMDEPEGIRTIAFVGDYPPRKCGIATFTYDLCHAVMEEYPECKAVVVPVNDAADDYDYPDEVRFEVQEQDLEAYRRAADFINFNRVDAVSLQHEFGIFGGRAGSHILAFLRAVRVPVVATMHTIVEQPTAEERLVTKELGSLVSRIVVMTERAKRVLFELYGVAKDRIDVIPHGIPDVPFVDPNFYKDQYGAEGKSVLLTFGLLSPNKGIETVLRALPKITSEFPDVVYIVLGTTHPTLLRAQGEHYRLGLERMVSDLGIQSNVVFCDRFVELEELKQFIGAADIYVTPYLQEAQSSSGTLAYAFGCGKAVISTPYWHAAELLADDRGVLVPFGDSDALAEQTRALLGDPMRLNAMRKRAYLSGREMVWSNVARLHVQALGRAREGTGRTRVKALSTHSANERHAKLPELRLSHLMRMTDATALLQHAKFSLPNLAEGYCTDDNARALVLTVLLEEAGYDASALSRVATQYASFLDYAFDGDVRHFRNFMSFDRLWLEVAGSKDSQGRAVWALGTCVGRSQRRDLQFWAAGLFDRAVRGAAEAEFPRSSAFTLLGINEYLRRLSGDRVIRQLSSELANRLLERYDACAVEEWQWFEDTLTYDNAVLPRALISAGRFSNNQRALDVGLRSLRWLCTKQRSERGYFRPIGCRGFGPRGEQAAQFDQQPLEAQSTISACAEAYATTGDLQWVRDARVAFEWFLGKNDLGIELYDPESGGCYDGLAVDRVNQNQGAESTLAFLISLAELRLLDNALSAFQQPLAADRRSSPSMAQ